MFPSALVRSVLWVFAVTIVALSVLALAKYPGQGHVYAAFTVLSSALLYSGFRKNAIFFDTFIGVFFWLGFWLKLTVRVAFMGGQFHEPVGNFDGTGAAFDRTLLVTSCGFLGLLVISYIRERFFFRYPEKISQSGHDGLRNFYQQYRKAVLVGFVFLVATIAATNAYFGIYQRGAVPRTSLPLGLGGIYSWLLLFGLASVSALILHFEYAIRKQATPLVAVLAIVETFLSNVSLLSRGMVLNSGALGYGVFRSAKLNLTRSNLRLWATSGAVFAILFALSVVVVNHLRTGEANARVLYRMTTPLFIDRWVGIEGVMAVTSYPERGWQLWQEAWEERHSPGRMSFYDTNIIDSPYKNVDKTRYHYVSLPGILAFCFYPGSFLFLFMSMFLLGAMAAAIEISVFRLGGGNIILCALLAQVVAYRYAHFGYAPSQSYLLFGALFLNLFLIYFSNKLLLWNKRTAVSAT